MAMDGGVLAMASGRQGSAGREKPNMPHSTYLPHCMGSAGIVGRWCDLAARAAAVIAGAMGDRAVLPESASDGCGGRCGAVASPAVGGWAGARIRDRSTTSCATIAHKINGFQLVWNNP